MIALPERRTTTVTQAYEQLLRRFLIWAGSQDAIRAIIQVGSRTRRDHPADEWADLDLMLYLNQPMDYLSRIDWLEAVAPVWLTVPSRTAGNDPELLVVFRGGYSVDFVFCGVENLAWLRDHVGDDLTFRRGARVLLDRDGLAAQITWDTPRLPTHPAPSPDEFRMVCHTFWYLSIYLARQLRRGDLWHVKMREAQLREYLLRMIAWHAGATSQWQADTWHNGRFMSQWADPRALEAIRDIFAIYDAEASRHALFASLRLFGWLARETAAHLGVEFPSLTEARVLALIHQAADDHSLSSSSLDT